MLNTNQFNTLWVELKRLSKEINKNSFLLLIDFIYCYFRYKCLPRQYIIGRFYEKRNFERKKILTYKNFCKLIEKHNNSKEIYKLKCKNEFNKIFDDFIKRDWLLCEENNQLKVEEFINKHNVIILKPLNQSMGNGIKKINISEISDIKKFITELCSHKVLIEECIVQHPDMQFNNKSVNTIRVNTLSNIHGTTIINCVLRAGVGDCFVDNYHSGGVIYPIDLELGIIYDTGLGKDNRKHFIHPKSDIVMLGKRIPNWDILKATVKDAAIKVKDIKIIGWDIAITPTGVEIIEGNNYPDYELFEFIGEGKTYSKIKKVLNDEL